MVQELPCPGAQYVFVGSNLHNPQQAEREILWWARQHGYRPRPQTPLFVTFLPSAARKEWLLLERARH